VPNEHFSRGVVIADETLEEGVQLVDVHVH
jgi:hypothetical protein